MSVGDAISDRPVAERTPRRRIRIQGAGRPPDSALAIRPHDLVAADLRARLNAPVCEGELAGWVEQFGAIQGGYFTAKRGGWRRGTNFKAKTASRPMRIILCYR